jgi:hypothetical protein
MTGLTERDYSLLMPQGHSLILQCVVIVAKLYRQYSDLSAKYIYYSILRNEQREKMNSEKKKIHRHNQYKSVVNRA